jgi:hypothetical protein
MERRIFKDNLKLGQRSRETLKMNGEYIYIKNSCFATRRIFRGERKFSSEGQRTFPFFLFCIILFSRFLGYVMENAI